MTVATVEENLEKRAISRSAFRVMLGGIFSILAGFVNQMIIAAYFGAGAEMDAYLTALVIPAYLQAVLLTGLSFVFIPAFVREETRGNDDAAWELVGTFFWITTGVLTAVTVAGWFLSRQIISLTAPGFGPEKSLLAARMLAVLMLSIPFSGLQTLTIGIQNARNRFFWPAFGGALNSLGNIVAVVALTPLVGPMALAWGFSVAVVSQSAITIIPVLRHGWPRVLPLTDNRIGEMAKLIMPFILFGVLTRGTSIFERYFASALPSGQISYLGYAGKIATIYQSLLATAIASAIFPAMARTYSQGGKEALGEKTAYGLRLTLAVAFPAVLITAALSIPLVGLLFQRGHFVSADTYHVALVLPIVLVSGLFCTMLSNILGRTFYVLKDTITSPLVSTVGVVIYIAIGRFFASRWGYVGLAYASLIQHALFILLLYVFLVRKVPDIALGTTLRSTFVYSLAAIGAYFIGKISLTTLSFLPRFIDFFIAGLASGIFYLVILYFYDREMLIAILEMFGIRRIPDLIRETKTRLAGSGLPNKVV